MRATWSAGPKRSWSFWASWRIWCTIACDLTCLLRLGSAFCSFPVLGVTLADVVAGCFVLVPGSLRASGAWPAGFRRGCGSADCVADATESPPDPRGGHRAGVGGPLPGQPQVRGERAGEPQLGVAGNDQPGPPVRGGGVAQQRGVPAQHLLE